MNSVQDLHTEAESNQRRKPLSCLQGPIPKTLRGERTSHLEQPGSVLRTTGLDCQKEAFETRVASPVTASLIQSGQNRFTKDCNRARPVCTTHRYIHRGYPQVPRKTPTGQTNPRDGMLATNLKSKFRQIGSAVMATTILHVTHEKKKEKTERQVAKSQHFSASYSTKNTLDSSNHHVTCNHLLSNYCRLKHTKKGR